MRKAGNFLRVFRAHLVLFIALAASLPAAAEVIRYQFSGALDKEVSSALGPDLQFGDRFSGMLLYDNSAAPWGEEQDNSVNARYRVYYPATRIRAHIGSINVDSSATASVMDAYAPFLDDGIGFDVVTPAGAPVINGFTLTGLQIRLYSNRQDYWGATTLPALLPRLEDVGVNWISGFWTSWTRGDEVVFASGSFERFREVPEPQPIELMVGALLAAFVAKRRRRLLT